MSTTHGLSALGAIGALAHFITTVGGVPQNKQDWMNLALSCTIAMAGYFAKGIE